MSIDRLTTCPNCGAEDRGESDFCASCGAYLRWGEDPADAETAVLTIVPVAAERPEPPTLPLTPLPEQPAIEPVLLNLWAAGARGTPGERPVVEAEPGGAAALVASVRNQSGVVDGFHLQVHGVPEQWVTIAPATVDLVPFGAENGRADAEVTISVRPPRSPDAYAGPWPLEVVAISRTSGAAVARAPATLVIGAYERFEIRVRPERVRGAGSARFAVPVRNLGNAPLPLELAGEDADGEARFSFSPPRLVVGVGDESHAMVTVSAPQPLSGRERERRLTIVVTAPQQALSGTASFVQRPRLTRGRLTGWRIVLGLLAVALLAGASFAAWTGDLTGLCLHGAHSCLRYDTFANTYIGYTKAPVPSDTGQLEGAFSLVTSAGMLTLGLALLTLIGLRRGGLAWFSGVLAVVLAVVLLVLGHGARIGLGMLFAGGVLAIVAGLLAGSRT